MHTDLYSGLTTHHTRTKLDIFQLYTREWLPVFLSKPNPIWKQIHIFDFFCGPGNDKDGIEGSPVRIVKELLEYKEYISEGKVKIYLHFSDISKKKTDQLKSKLRPLLDKIVGIQLNILTLDFREAFKLATPILESDNSAKMVLIDPFGVFDDSLFKLLVAAKFTDFLLFVPSSFLHRFRDHFSIKVPIEKPLDFYHVHKSAFKYYRSLIPPDKQYYLAPFSIKKPNGIYGIIFGSSHPLGMDKFLITAWDTDKLNGEANFDINREDIKDDAPYLELEGFSSIPKKIGAFESTLKEAILSGRCSSESDIVALCFEHGVKRQHSKDVLLELKRKGLVRLAFQVPQINSNREFTLLRKEQRSP